MTQLTRQWCSKTVLRRGWWGVTGPEDSRLAYDLICGLQIHMKMGRPRGAAMEHLRSRQERAPS